MDYFSLLQYNWPDLVIVVALFIALGVDYSLMRGKDLLRRSRAAATVTFLGVAVALAGVLWQLDQNIAFHSAAGQIDLTPLTLAFKAIIFALALFVIIFSVRIPPSGHVSEYYALLLL